MKPYEKYKDSGVAWIGKVPEHWEVKRLKYVGDAMPSNIDKKSKEDEREVLLCNYVDVYKNDFIKKGMPFMQATASEAQIEKFELKKGDVIATKDSEDPNDIAVPALVTENLDGVVCGYHLTLIRSFSNNLNGGFLFWLLKSKFYGSYFSTEANGVTRFGIGTNSFKVLPTILPPLPEQTAIARYLDQKTTEIDQLIAQKERLLALWEEEKTALINQAVTRGLDAGAKMKDSGVAWLGEVPEHWEVKRLKYVLKEKLQYGANEPSEFENPEDPRYIRITDFDDSGSLRSDTFKSLPLEKAREYLLNEGDILFARSGATVGKTFQFKNYSGTACYAGYLIRAVVNQKIMLPDFLYFFTKSGAYSQWKDSIFNQATIQNIGADKYAYLEIPIPPLPEQAAIVRHIETQTARIQTQMDQTRKLIELLREYRATLISEVVTGKVKIIA